MVGSIACNLPELTISDQFREKKTVLFMSISPICSDLDDFGKIKLTILLNIGDFDGFIILPYL